MSHTPRKIELLAPAKDYETGVAAINHGADAVYIGAAQFGARQAAGNSVEDIARLVDYAHIFGVKVYVTLNTIIYDDEVSQVEQLVKELYEHRYENLSRLFRPNESPWFPPRENPPIALLSRSLRVL